MKLLFTLGFASMLFLVQAQKHEVLTLDSAISISWHSKLGYIPRDSLFAEIESNYSYYRPIILTLLNDTSEMGFQLCSKTALLRKGDFAWMLLRELRKIPKECSIRRFNTYRGMCPYPEGFLDYFEENRGVVAEEIRTCVL